MQSGKVWRVAQASDQYCTCGEIEALACFFDQLIDLTFADYQWRRDDHGVANGAHDQSVLEAMGTADHADTGLAREKLEELGAFTAVFRVENEG